MGAVEDRGGRSLSDVLQGPQVSIQPSRALAMRAELGWHRQLDLAQTSSCYSLPT